MEVKITEGEGLKRVLEIEVPGKEVEEQLEAAYKDYQRQVQIPGFRKGKAPLGLIKARFGKFIEEAVIGEIISRTLEDVRREKDIQPVFRATIDKIDYGPGKPLRFRARVEVRPTIDLKRYKGIEVTKRVPVVQEEDVDRVLDNLRHRHARVYPVRGEAREGHYLVADIQWLDHTGVPLVGEKLEDFEFELGKSDLGWEFDQHLIGVRPGEQRVFQVTYPEDYPDESVAGPQVMFSVKVKEITEQRLPELNDEFAREIGDYNTLEELRQKVLQDLKDMAEWQAEEAVRREIINTLLHENPFEAPEAMVEYLLQDVVQDIRSRTGEQDEAVIGKEFRPWAVWQVRKFLILDEVRKRENLVGYTDGEVLEFLVQNAKINVVQDEQERVEI